jgi:hypothetical protein
MESSEPSQAGNHTRQYLGRKGKEVGGLIIVAVFLCWIFNLPQSVAGARRPGALIERRLYSASVYVLVFPNAHNAKNYRLPGFITREDSCDPNSDLYIGLGGGDANCGLEYSLSAIKWPNGGHSTFEGCIVGFFRDSFVGCADQSNRTYYFELTKDVVI